MTLKVGRGFLRIPFDIRSVLYIRLCI
jgi:hypothetical protein